MQCEGAEQVTSNREYRVVNATYQDTPVTICSTGIGGPSAAIALEEMANVGVKTFLRCGTTGALQPHIEIGDMIVATGAAKEEGTTKRYESATYPATPDQEVVSTFIDVSRARDENVHVGPIVTDDAFYNETEDYVSDWSEAGLLCVEMEAATLFTLSRRRGLSAGAICTVDGNLVEGTQKGVTDDDELPERAKDNVERAIHITLETASRLA
ncbi:MAG: nucleoside phosphorylase [Halobacteriaceae archaeon]